VKTKFYARAILDKDEGAVVAPASVSDLEPQAVILDPLVAGLLGIIPRDGEAERLVDDLQAVAAFDDNEPDIFTKWPVVRDAEQQSAPSDQGAQIGVDLAIVSRAGDSGAEG